MSKNVPTHRVKLILLLEFPEQIISNGKLSRAIHSIFIAHFYSLVLPMWINQRILPSLGKQSDVMETVLNGTQP